MHRAIRITLFSTAGVMAVAAVAAASLLLAADIRMERRIPVRLEPVAYATGLPAIAAGRYLYESRGCAECHGESGEGRVVIDDPNGLHVRGPDLTPAGVTMRYTEADWVRAIRHGVSPDGRPLLVMPSEDFNQLTDVDLANLVAYVRSLPPAAGTRAEIRLPFLVKAIYALGLMTDAAAKIDHARPAPGPVPAAATREHGAYVAQACIGCHGATLAGGKIPGTPPDWPPAADLSRPDALAVARYSDPAAFRAMMRTGLRPDGSLVSSVMPFQTFKRMTDTDLDALHAYLRGERP